MVDRLLTEFRTESRSGRIDGIFIIIGAVFLSNEYSFFITKSESVLEYSTGYQNAYVRYSLTSDAKNVAFIFVNPAKSGPGL